MGNAVQPVAHHLPWHNGGGLTSQNEEGCLEGIFAVVVIAKHSAAHAQHHRAMPPHQSFKGRFLATTEVALQQFPIRQAGGVTQDQSPKLLDNAVH